jgi:asparaginyl-tRNA synthetase
MSLVNISELSGHLDQEVNLRGWLYGKRSGGKIIFLLVRDGTGLCQCPVEQKDAEAFAAAGALTPESSLRLSGRVRRDDRAPGGYEVAVRALAPIQIARDYPITRKAHGIDFLFSHRHLWLRSPRQAAILRVRHTVITAVRRFFDERGFTLIDTPILSPGAAEGAGTLFRVDYFGEEVFLAQTGPLYLESACLALGKVYCFGPTFRAEKSKTRRHLTEFWMVEPEIAFAELPDLLQEAEAMTCYLVAAVLEKHRDDLRLLERDPAPLERVAPPFPRLTYSEAVDRLRHPDTLQQLEQQLEEDRRRLANLIQELSDREEQLKAARPGWSHDKLEGQVQELREQIRLLQADVENQPAHIEQARTFPWGKDLGGAEETMLSRQFDRPVFITEYPRAVKAFYMKRSPARPDVVLNLDMLAPEGYGEIIGGSQREDDLDALLQRMAEEGMATAPYEWYLDLRRYGSVPHGGFGLGIERTVAWLCGLKHIRETIPFPRMMGKIYP